MKKLILFIIASVIISTNCLILENKSGKNTITAILNETDKKLIPPIYHSVKKNENKSYILSTVDRKRDLTVAEPFDTGIILSRKYETKIDLSKFTDEQINSDKLIIEVTGNPKAESDKFTLEAKLKE